jgi:hypothetical protein
MGLLENIIAYMTGGPTRKLDEAVSTMQSMMYEPITSSWINTAKYNAALRAMTMKMEGRTYTYYNVSPEMYEYFLQAPSKGAFFNQRIKGYHAFTRA